MSAVRVGWLLLQEVNAADVVAEAIECFGSIVGGLGLFYAGVEAESMGGSDASREREVFKKIVQLAVSRAGKVSGDWHLCEYQLEVSPTWK